MNAVVRKPKKPVTRISRKMMLAVEHFVNDPTLTQIAIADLVGLSREAVCRGFKRQHVQAMITKKAMERMAGAIPVAVNTTVTLAKEGTEGSRLRASRMIFDEQHRLAEKGAGASGAGAGHTFIFNF